jgi:hypothetical protein
MKKLNFLVIGVICTVVLFTMLACSLTGGGEEEVRPTPKSSTLRQWASSASASSEYGSDSWSAAQVIGSPDTSECGESTTAWASSYYDGVDWLEVGFATPVVPTQINIYETYNPGSIVKVEVRDEEGSFHTVYEATPAYVEECPRTFKINISDIDFKVTSVLISLDQSILMEWDEIDAVELVGRP